VPAFIQTYRPYLLLASLLLLLALLPDSWQNVLRYSRADIATGSYWQLFSGHLLHSNHWHLLMNLAGLLLAMLLHGRYFSATELSMQWLFGTLLISLALYTFSPAISVYVGLSGLLHCLLTIGAIMDIRKRQRGGWLLLIGLGGKVLWEQWQGPDASLAELINANVAIDAHLYGVLSGCAIGLSCWLWQRVKMAPGQ
jgi:rhomboid family GlyGly-CTERM serine protease